jgi:hypothetical protein
MFCVWVSVRQARNQIPTFDSAPILQQILAPVLATHLHQSCSPQKQQQQQVAVATSEEEVILLALA